MIKFVTGDILFSKAGVIAHGVAPHDHFEQGLALALREQWPAMVKDFRHWCHNQNPQPGEAWVWGGADGTRIVNLLTQDSAAKSHSSHPGAAKKEYLNHALKAFRKIIDNEKFSSVAIPKLATGVGAMDWNEVRPLIEKHLGDLSIPVFIYDEYQKGVVAEEVH